MTAPAALLRDVKTAANSKPKIFVSVASDPYAPARGLFFATFFGQAKKVDSKPKESIGEFLCIERTQVIEPLAHADPLDWDIELFLYADNHSALSRAVKFG